MRAFPFSTYFVTLSEPGRKEGVPLWTKDEAEAALKPFKDRLRREGAAFLIFWEQQSRGSWHPHMLISKRYHLGKSGEGHLRDWLTTRGWGPQMKFKYVEVPTAVCRVAEGFGLNPGDDAKNTRAWKLVRYMIKYLRKGIVEDGVAHKKLFGGSASAKKGDVKFNWMPGINPSSYLYHFGRELFVEIEGRIPAWDETQYCIRLGVEATNWMDIDPWWQPWGVG